MALHASAPQPSRLAVVPQAPAQHPLPHVPPVGLALALAGAAAGAAVVRMALKAHEGRVSRSEALLQSMVR